MDAKSLQAVLLGRFFFFKIGRSETRWYETNPSLGVLIDETTIEGELSRATEDFARERLGWWSPVSVVSAVINESL
ncbi:hypothetical protein [Olegusella massiliensis]|uniref:hypothetical protein n=1 Tax=Olegusella massiliensis TaxID=1776381 RepID=UPI0023F6C1E8|nr:hypothetical protein [Olegusella massiliensis]